MIQAAIFDMDGLLVDSEPFWREVEIEVFRTVGLEMDDEMCKRTTGLPTDTVVRYWYEKHPWHNRSVEEVNADIIQGAYDQIGKHAGPMPGVPAILELFRQQGIPMAIASASPMHLIEVVLDRLNIRSYFTLWHSATLEKRNKPHPDVYLGTARKLGVEPHRCVAFEDSGNGLKSAHAAEMLTVSVPADYEFDDPKFDLATLKIPSLTAFTLSQLRELENQLSITQITR
ncbi:hexitol phosphatase HxpB [Larkinella punicea]|uniref:Hexitol phosphatase HxpB n=1 Tax=Larkinella punicea TaxID=2315727 RepID=A0A368JGB5_9BACT|nr:hexitol phosphatase HxpB [Larkinella punicea]RCR65734.1 hexitol phosphatase HxpB [Larkinella punicea]